MYKILMENEIPIRELGTEHGNRRGPAGEGLGHKTKTIKVESNYTGH